VTISVKYRTHLHQLPIATVNETWELLADMRVRNSESGEDYVRMITEVIDAYMAEIMDRAEADNRRVDVMRSAFGGKAEPAAGTSAWDYATKTYEADCLHCGLDIHQVLVKGNRLVWAHVGAENERCV